MKCIKKQHGVIFKFNIHFCIINFYNLSWTKVYPANVFNKNQDNWGELQQHVHHTCFNSPRPLQQGH